MRSSKEPKTPGSDRLRLPSPDEAPLVLVATVKYISASTRSTYMSASTGSTYMSASTLKVLKRIYWKYLRAAMTRNFSMKSSESRTAMWAARPIRELVLFGRACWISYLGKQHLKEPELYLKLLTYYES